MRYSKSGQLKRKKRLTQAALNRKANQKLAELRIAKDIRHCELCPARGVTNAHRYPRRWYKGKPPELLWDYSQVLFICVKCHTRLDDRSRTSEEEKKAVFERLRGSSSF